LSRYIKFTKFDSQGEEIQINFPPDIADGILHRKGKWNFPVLTGIVHTRLIRPDGTLIEQPRLRSAYRLYLGDDAVFPETKISTDEEDALAHFKCY